MWKPSWEDAPNWATALTQNQYGEWEWHENTPASTRRGWFNSGRTLLVQVTNWTDSLEYRPELKLDDEFEDLTLVDALWEDAPDWAIFIGQDYDGDWYAFDCIPEYSTEDGYWKIPPGRDTLPLLQYLGYSDVKVAGAFTVGGPHGL